LATQDAHYLRADHAESHEVMLAIGTNGAMVDPNRFRFPDPQEYWFKTRDEMREGFGALPDCMDERQIEEALDNTLVLGEQCCVGLDTDRFKALLPEVELPNGSDNEFNYISDLCMSGWLDRDIPDRIRLLADRDGLNPAKVQLNYIKRLGHELKVIRDKKFIPYFLMGHELYEWANAQGIAHGPGRGSAAGSLVLYLLGLTEVDPLEHGLLFERFIGEGRIDLPDLDCDFDASRREEIIVHLEEKYGSDKVCRISSFGTLANKQAVRDVARVYEVPYPEVLEVTAKMDKDLTLVENLEQVPECTDFGENYPEVTGHSLALEGMVKSLGVHGAGVVVSSAPITDILPVETRADKRGGPRVRVSSVDMHGVQDLGLVKLDVLGLRTVTILQRAVDAIRERHGIEIDPWQLDLNDTEALAGFTAQDFNGIFQFDTPAMARVAAGVEFKNFAEIAAMNALNRPGPARSGLTEKYLKRKKGRADVDWDGMHPIVADITRDTYGVLVYQEQVMRLLSELGWFDAAATDEVRKKIGKSKGKKEIEPIRARFVSGAIEQGMEPDEAHALMDAVVEFGGSSFNMSHSVAYSMISYACMWIKRRYPLEFFWSLLVSESKDSKIRRLTRAAKRRGLEVLPPHVSSSGAVFTIDAENAIRGSLSDIKYVGEKAAAEIMEKQPYTDLVDLFERTQRRAVNKRAVHSLLLAGALDGLVPSVKALVDGFDAVWACALKGKHEQLGILLDAMKGSADYDERERAELARGVNPMAHGAHALDEVAELLESHILAGLEEMDGAGFYAVDRACYVLATVQNVAVGGGSRDAFPFGAAKGMGPLTSDGKTSAGIYVEDLGGGEHRIRVDWTGFGRYGHCVEH
ncbi:hypothetical protein LCGC14_1841520, partial [marine sediment metagenome]